MTIILSTEIQTGIQTGIQNGNSTRNSTRPETLSTRNSNIISTEIRREIQQGFRTEVPEGIRPGFVKQRGIQRVAKIADKQNITPEKPFFQLKFVLPAGGPEVWEGVGSGVDEPQLGRLGREGRGSGKKARERVSRKWLSEKTKQNFRDSC